MNTYIYGYTHKQIRESDHMSNLFANFETTQTSFKN